MRLTRSLFLVAVLLALAALLPGCGSGSKPDNTYQGAYRAAYTIPGLSESGTFSYTVGQKGGMTGSFTDSTGLKSTAFSGQLENNGAFSGTITDAGKTYSINGTLATTGATSGGGDFSETRNGVVYRGSFTVGTTPPAAAASIFQGAFNGGYSVPGVSGTGQSGQVSYSVDQTGGITGSLTRGTDTGLLTGTVANTGVFSANVTFKSQPTSVTLRGTLVKTTDSSSVGNFVETVSGVDYPGSFGKTTVSTGDSPFIGSYRGTYSLPERAESGNISFTVGPNGTLVGFLSLTENQPVGTLTGAFANDGTFSGTVTYDKASGLTDRAITGKLATSSVSGKRSGDFVETINGNNLPGNFEVSVGGSEPDSIFRGSYGASNSQDGWVMINGSGGILPTTQGDLSLTIDKEGAMIGTFIPANHSTDPNETDPTRVAVPPALNVTGICSNDGRFVATVNGGKLHGKIARQNIRSRAKDRVPAFGTTPESPAVFEFKSGFAGDYVMTVNGVDYPGSIEGIGGN